LPPVVLVSGLNITRGWFNVDLFGNPAVLVFIYAVVAMPFTYRIIATAVAAADLDSLVDAARLLGARPIQVLLLVVVPLIRRPLGNVALIAAAFCFGEYAIASLLAFGTFPVWLTVLGQQASHAAVALSAITLVGPWIVLMAVSLLIRNWRIAPIPDDSAVPRPESADERAATEPSHLPNGNEPALSIRSFQ
jgi:putative spermidine/putrescine transport system permease protein